MEFVAPLFAFVVVVAVLGVSMYFAAQARRRWTEALHGLAARHDGLRYDATMSSGAVVGEAHGVAVHVDSYTTGSGKNKRTWTRWRLSDPRGLPRGSSLSTERGLAFLGKVFTGEDLQIGDRRFDDTVLIRGPVLPLHASLDADARAKVKQAVEAGWTVQDGEWTWRRSGRVTDVEALQVMLDEGFDLCRAVRRDAEVTDQLAEVIRTDPVPGVRVRALQSWIQLGEPPQTLLQWLAEEDDTLVGLLAARTRRDLPALERLVRAPTKAVRIQAAITVAELGARKKGTSEHLPAIRAALVVGLDVEPWVDTCIQQLGALGTVAEVEALQGHATGVWPGPRKQRATQAIRAIQARAVGAEAGQISLVEAEGGALSVAEDPQHLAGRLSQRTTES